MINPEDLRIGATVQTNEACTFPNGPSSIVTDIHHERLYNAYNGAVTLKAANGEDDGPCGTTWCNNIDGVPITPEILRNNGFKEDVEGKYFTRPIKARSGSSLARYLAIERKKYSWAIFIKYYTVTGYALLCHIKYVHELQLTIKIVKFSPEMKV